MQDSEKIYKTAELAKMFRVSSQTVQRWIREGKLEAYRVGHTWRITKEALEQFLMVQNKSKE